jgi:hypothetical protein
MGERARQITERIFSAEAYVAGYRRILNAASILVAAHDKQGRPVEQTTDDGTQHA